MQEIQVQSMSQGRSPGRGHGNPLYYSCLENPMDRGAWRAIVYGATEIALRVHAHTQGISFLALRPYHMYHLQFFVPILWVVFLVFWCCPLKY